MDLWYPPDEFIATAGDLIAFQRRLKKVPYLHYAVCTVSPADNPRAIVYQNGDRITVGVDTPQLLIFTQIVEKTIGNQCNEHGGRVNNLDEAAEERGLRPLPPDVIVERAREFLRHNRSMIYYNVLTKNCEHFATKCRYAEGFSLQVSDFRKARGNYLSEFFSNLFSKLSCSHVDAMGEAIERVKED